MKLEQKVKYKGLIISLLWLERDNHKGTTSQGTPKLNIGEAVDDTELVNVALNGFLESWEPIV